eukprot:jgi/Hompol1/858/HPOL_001344-RA
MQDQQLDESHNQPTKHKTASDPINGSQAETAAQPAAVEIRRKKKAKSLRRDHRYLSKQALLPAIEAVDVIRNNPRPYFTMDDDSKRISDDIQTVMLEYPGDGCKEIFPLVIPGKTSQSEYNPINDIYVTTQMIAQFCLSEEQSERVGDSRNGIVRRVIKACHRRDPVALQSAIADFNQVIVSLKDDGAFEQDEIRGPPAPYPLITHILEQAYARSVAPVSHLLNNYQGFSNNVYGEIKQVFVHDLIKQAGIMPHHIFLDMGSGIGNVILQVAAECLCESYGIEIMEIPSQLAVKQRAEFLSRMRYYAKPCGRIIVKQGDFLEDAEIHDVISRADVIFVNNDLSGVATKSGESFQAVTAKLSQLNLADKEGLVSFDSFLKAVSKIREEKGAVSGRDDKKIVLHGHQENTTHTINVDEKESFTVHINQQLAEDKDIIKIGLQSNIDIKVHPELFRLLEPGELLEDFLKLPAEQILLRWFNYHLKKAGHTRKVNNFTSDIKDGENYTVLLHQLAPSTCSLAPMRTSDLFQRAEQVLDNADKIGCRKYLTPKTLVEGNQKLNFAFVAHLFNTHPGLEKLTEAEMAQLDEWLFSSEGDREARAFALWLNSLGVDPFVNNLFDDLTDGLILLQAMDKVRPGIVDWKKVNKPAPIASKFKKVENTNYVVVLGKSMKFSLVGIQGSDIVDANKTLTLGLVWQLMREHVVQTLKSLSNAGHDITDSDIIKWANDSVRSAGKASSMSNFKDPALSTSVFFLDLIDSIKKGVVNYELVTSGTTGKLFGIPSRDSCRAI